MKKIVLVLALCAGLFGSSCVGSWRAFNGVASWNSRATDSKWWNTAINVGMWIVPVYELMIFADMWVFNTIEFWTGSNPINEADRPQEGGQPKK